MHARRIRVLPRPWLARADDTRRFHLVSGERETVVGSQMDHRPLRQRGDRQQRVDAERARDRRAVDHVQPLVHGGRAPSRSGIEDLASVVDHAAAAVLAHAAAAERMRGRRLVAHNGARERVLDILSAGFARDRRQDLVETAVDGLVAGPRPAELKPVVLQPSGPRRCRGRRRKRSAGWRTAPCRRR